MIKLLILSNNEHVIGKLQSDDQRGITLLHPVYIVIKNRDNSSYYQMSPYSLCSDTLLFKREFVMAEGEAYPELAKSYELAITKYTESGEAVKFYEPEASSEEELFLEASEVPKTVTNLINPCSAAFSIITR